KWISIGGADQKPDGSQGLVKFLFDGIQPIGSDAGKIIVNGSTVAPRTALVTDVDLVNSTTAHLQADGTLLLTGAALDTIRSGSPHFISNDIYLRTPALLENCAIRMAIVETPDNFEEYDIAHAVYDEGSADPGDESLTISVTDERGPLQGFIDRNAGPGRTVGFQLMPRFFRVVTNNLEDSLPTNTFVRLQFQAARDNGTGAPDEANPLVDWTSNIAQFNSLPPGQLQFFRFQVEFDLDSQGQGVSVHTVPVNLEFLRIPFVF